jgi:hypothetical protein
MTNDKISGKIQTSGVKRRGKSGKLLLTALVVIAISTGVLTLLPSVENVFDINDGGNNWNDRNFEAEQEGYFEYLATGTPTYASITGYNGSASTVVIPSTLGGYPVTQISEYAFRDCTGIKSIDLNNVEIVMNGAFLGCTGLTSVSMPIITSIGANAFDGCTGISSVTLTPGIGTGMGAGLDYTDSTYQRTPWYVSTAAELTVTLNDGITSIGREMFAYSDNIKTITMPDSVKSIGRYAFRYSTGLTSVTMPNVTNIGEFAFGYCTGLISVSMPNVTSIGNMAFFNCIELTEAYMPNVTLIGNYAFDTCTELTNVYMPNVTSVIGEDTFYDCSGLISIDVGTDNPIYSSADGVLFNKDMTALVKYPQGMTGTYTVPESVISIKDSAFGHGRITSVTLPNVTNIGTTAFFDCTELTDVYMPRVTSIGTSAFSQCINLTNIYMPNVTSIGDRAFSQCTELTDVYMPRVTSIGDSAFSQCTGLVTIAVGGDNPNYSSVDGVLFNKDGTTLVLYPAGRIGAYTVPDSVTSIGEYAFFRCTGITEIYMPKVTSIGEYAFFSCTGLTSAVMPSVMDIGRNAFSGCTKLKSIAIPAATTLNSGAFTGKVVRYSGAAVNVIAYAADDGDVMLRITVGSGNAVDDVTVGSTSGATDIPVSLNEDAYKISFGTASLAYVVVTEKEVSGSYEITVNVSGNGKVQYTSGSSPELKDPIGNKIQVESGYITIYATPGANYRSSIISINGGTEDTDGVFTASEGGVVKIDFIPKEYQVRGEPETSSIQIMEGSSVISGATYGLATHGTDYMFTISSDYILKVTIRMGSGAERELMQVDGTYIIHGMTITDTITIKAVITQTFKVGDFELIWIRNSDGANTITITESINSSGKGSLIIPTMAFAGETEFTITAIGNNAFQGCTRLTSVTIPTSVTSIGNSAFQGCTGLTSVTIPTSVTSIGNNAFQGCTGLTSVTIPTSVISIGNNAFLGCTRLTSVTIPTSVTSIGNNAFQGCTGLTSVTIPTSVTSIGNNAFQGCTGLDAVAIPYGITLGASAFPSNAKIVWYAGAVSATAYIESGNVMVKFQMNADRVMYSTSAGTVLDKDDLEITAAGDAWLAEFPSFGDIFVTVVEGYELSEDTTGNGKVQYKYADDDEFSDLVGTVKVKNGVIIIKILPNEHNTLDSLTLNGEDMGMETEFTLDGRTVVKVKFTPKKFTVEGVPETIYIEILEGSSVISGTAYGEATYSIDYEFTVDSRGPSLVMAKIGVEDAFEVLFDSGRYVIDGSLLIDNVVLTVTDLRLVTGDFVLKTEYAASTTDVTITGYYSEGANLVIPDTFETNGITYTVIRIGNNAFSNLTGLTVLTLPGTLTHIGTDAFSGCTGITTLVIPINVTFGTDAFRGCVDISDITLTGTGAGNNFLTGYTRTPWYMSNVPALTVTLDENITSIGDYTFYGCENIISISLAGVMIIGDNAFNGCIGLTTLIMQADADIGTDSFYGCVNISDVTLKGTGTTKSMSASHEKTPWYISTVDELTVTLDDDITGIGEFVFYGCENLLNINLGNIISFGANSFSGCVKLKTIDLSNVDAIGENAFFGCIGFETMIVRISTLEGTNIFDGCVNISDLTLIGSGSTGTFKPTTAASTIWSLSTADTLKITLIGITEIGDYTFYGCENLTSINLENIASIGSYAFQDCVGLTTIKMQMNVSMSTGAFSGCTAVSDVTLTGTGTRDFGSIYGSMPWNISTAEELTVTLSEGITGISDSMFNGCENLVSITMPGVTTIGSYAFNGCSKLKGMNSADGKTADLTGVTRIGIYTFQGCVTLTTVYMPDVVNAYDLGLNAFSGCVGLTTMTMHISVIGANAFSGCTALSDVTLTGNGDIVNFDSSTYTNTPWGSSTAAELTVTLGDDITGIGNYLFYNRSNLVSITMPGVTSIGASAFYDCTGLKTLNMPLVDTLGTDAFYQCTGLTTVTMRISVTAGGSVFAGSDGVSDITLTGDGSEWGTSSTNYQDTLWYVSKVPELTVTLDENITVIGEYAFYLCNNLVSITMPGVTTIENHAFYGCSKLETVDLSKVEEIGEYAFYGCSKLKEAYMPLAETISENAFSGCFGLISVYMPVAETISDHAFSSCSGLTVVDMPSVTKIGDYAFYNCTGLISVDMELAEEIGEYAFSGCTSLTVVDMPSVTVIGGNAFSSCTELTEIIMLSVTKIGDDVFAGSMKISSITISPDNKEFFVEDNAFASKTNERLIMFLGRDLMTYTVPKSIKIIGGYAFQDCVNLVSIDMTSVLTIEGYAFSGCIGLMTVETSAETIGNNAFYMCTGLTSVSMPDAIMIGGSAFSECENLLQVSMPSVTTIGNRAFYGCAGLTAIDLSIVETVGDGAFQGCIGLTSVSMPDATTIGTNAFSGCGNLLQVLMPSAKSIGEFAFSECIGLTTVSMPEVITLKRAAFTNCTGLTTVNMPNVKTIEQYAFLNCIGLTMATMPNVTDIQANAFIDSNGLKAITVKNVTMTIAPSAFPAGTKIVKYSGDAVSITAYDVIGDDVMVIILVESGYHISSVTGTSGGGEITPTEVGDAWSIPIASGSDRSEIVITAATGGYEILFEIEGEGEIRYYIDSADPKPLLSDRIQVKSGSTVTIEADDGANYVFSSLSFNGTFTQVTDKKIVASTGGIVKVVLTPKTYDITNSTTDSVTITEKGGSAMTGTLTGAATPGDDFVFLVNGNGNPVKVTVAIGSAEPRELMLVNGEYTIPGITITGDITIKATVVNTMEAGYSNITLTFTPNTDGENTLTITNVVVPSWSPVLEIPDTVFFGGAAFRFTQIAEDAFDGCEAITEITIPSTVLYIYEGLFAGSPSLTKINVHSNNPDYSSLDGVLFNKSRTELMMFPMGKAGEYTIPSTVKTIAASAFAGRASLTELTIPSSVTSIGEGAFKGCDGLTAITVSAGNLNYSSDEKALFNKDQTVLIRFVAIDDTVYTIPSNVTEISEYAFAGCTALNVLAIPYGAALGTNAFSGRIIWYSGALSATAYMDGSDTKMTFRMNTDRIIFDISAGTEYEFTDVSITPPPGVSDVYTVGGSGETFVIITEGYEISASITNDSKGKVQYKSVDDIVFKDLTGITKVRNGETEIMIIPNGHHTFESLRFNSDDKTADTFTVDGSGTVYVTFMPKTFKVFGEPETSEIRIINGAKTIQGTAYGEATYGVNYAFTVTATGPVTVTVKIGSTSTTATPNSGGIYTIAGTNIISDVTIVVAEYLVPAGADFSVKVKYLTGTNVVVTGYTGKGTVAVLEPSFVYNGTTYTITEIGANAFKGCSIVSLAIPSTVTAIADSAFADCNALVTMTATGNMNFVVDGKVLFDTARERIIRYMDRTAAHYTIPSTVDTIGGYAFQYSALTSVTIHPGVTMIGNGAFADCSGLKAIAVPLSAVYTWHLAFDRKDLVIYSGDTTDVTATVSGTDVVLKINVADGRIVRNVTLGSSSSADNAVRNEDGDTVTFAIPDGTLYLGVTDVARYQISANITGNGKVEYKMERDSAFNVLISAVYVGGDVDIRISPVEHYKISSLKFGTDDKDGAEFTIAGATVVNVTFVPVPYRVISAPGSDTTVKDSSGTTLSGTTYGEADYGIDYKFTVDSQFLVSVMVKIGGGDAVEFFKGSDEKYTIPGGSITGEVIITAAAFIVTASDFELKVSVSGSDATVMGYIGGGAELEIPETFLFNGSTYTVKAIGAAVFVNCTGVTSLTIPNSVTSIGGSAFDGCIGLRTITMPLNTSFGTDSFEGCVRVNDVTLTGSGEGKNFSTDEYIRTPWYVITNADLTVTLDDDITSIGTNTFRGCTSMVSITMSGVTSIGDNAFLGCNKLTEIDLSKVTSIGDNAFLGCLQLTSLNISAATNIGSAAFKDCTGLMNVTMSLNVVPENNAFQDCVNITEVTLTGTGAGVSFTQSSYTYTLWYASQSTSLSITVTEGITSIGSYTFNQCTNLTSIILPDSVKTVGSYAFSGCNNLETAIMASVTTIEANAFQNCTSLMEIDMHSAVDIGNNAFSGCSGLTTVIMPLNVKLGTNAFNGSTNISKITLTGTGDGKDFTTTEYGGTPWFISNTGSLTIVLDEKITSIGNNTFRGCENLMSINLGKITSIGDYAFYGCVALDTVDIPLVETIGASAFEGCNSLRRIDGLKVTEVGNDAFYRCGKLATVNMPSLEIIGASAFSSCNTLSSIDLSKATDIGANAFNGCIGLTSVTISSSITDIGLNAFAGCTGLRAIAIPGHYDLGSYSGRIIEYSGAESVTAKMTGTNTVELTIVVSGGKDLSNVKLGTAPGEDNIAMGGTGNVRTFTSSNTDTVYLEIFEVESNEITVAQNGTNGTLKYSVGSGQSTSIPSDGKIPKGTETISIIAEPSAGYGVTWTFDPSTAGTANGNTATINAACTVTATFVLKTYDVNVISGSDITVKEGDTPITGTRTVTHGSDYTFEVESSNAVYVTVKVGSGPVVEVFDSGGQYVIENVTGSVEIHAEAAYSVTFTGGHGTIMYQRSVDDKPKPYDGSFTGPAGTKLIIIPSPDSGYILSYPAGGVPAGDGKVTFSNATGSIHLEFIQSFAVTVNVNGTNGTVNYTISGGEETAITDPVKEIQFNDGQTVRITASPSLNYVVSITVNGGSVSDSYVVVNETCVVNITFLPATFNVIGAPGTGTTILEDGKPISGSTYGKATYGKDYVFTVTRTGVDIQVYWKKTSADDSTYAVATPDANGKYTIIAENVTEDITVKTVNVYSVTVNGNEASRVGTGNAAHGQQIVVELAAGDHYVLPGTVSVTVGGTTVATTTGYEYNEGKVTVFGDSVTGAIVITANCVPEEYVVTLPSVSDRYSLSLSSEKAVFKGTLTVTITLKAGHRFVSPSLTLTGESGAEVSGPVMSQGKAVFTISGFTDDFGFTVSGVEKETYNVTVTGTNVSRSGEGRAEYSTEIEVTIVAAPHYVLPDTISVTVGGNDASFDYDPSTGKVTVHAVSVTGAITITAHATAEKYTVTVPDETDGYSVSSSSEKAVYEGSLTVTVTLKSGYRFVSPKLLFTDNNVKASAPVTDSGKAVFTVTGFTADFGFSVDGVVPEEYEVGRPGDGRGYYVSAPPLAVFGGEYKITITLSYGYTGTDLDVTIDGSGTAAKATLSASEYVFTVTGYTGPFGFTVSGVEKAESDLVETPGKGYVAYAPATAVDGYEIIISLAPNYDGTAMYIETADGTATVPTWVSGRDYKSTVAEFTGVPSFTVSGIVPNEYTVTHPSGDGYTLSDAVKAKYGEGYVVKITLKDGYTNSVPRISSPGLDATQTSKVDNEYTFVIEGFTGDFGIVVSGVVLNEYDVTSPGNGDGYTVAVENKVMHGGKYTIRVTLLPGYTGSSPVVALTQGSSGTLGAGSKDNNVYTIEVTDCIGHSGFTVSSVALNEYDVEFSESGTGYTVDANKKATHGRSYVITVTVLQGYTNSDPIVSLSSGSAVKDAKGNNVYTFTLANVTGGFSFSVYEVAANEYAATVPDDGTGYTVTATENATFGTDYVITVTLKTGYTESVPSVVLSQESTGSASKGVKTGDTYRFVVTGFTGKIEFSVSGVVANKYVLTVNAGANGSVSGSGTYEYDSERTLTAIPDEGYRFLIWNDGNTDSVRIITVSAAATYTATFVAIDTEPADLDDVFSGNVINADVLKQLLENSVDGVTLRIPADTPGLNDLIIPKEVFEDGSCDGKVLEVIITNANGDMMYRWMFDGNDTYDSDPTLSLKIVISMSVDGTGAPSGMKLAVDKYIDDNGLEEEAIYLNFSATGTLPYNTTITYNVGAEFAGKTFRLFYYGATLEDKLQTRTVNPEGFIVFTIDHCSSYALITTESAPIIPDPEPYGVTVHADDGLTVTAAATATEGVAYTFTVTGTNDVTVTVGGLPVTPAKSGNTYTIPEDKVNGVIVITAKAVAPTPDPEGSGGNGGSSMMFVAIGVVIAVIALIAVYFLVVKKKA